MRSLMSLPVLLLIGCPGAKTTGPAASSDAEEEVETVEPAMVEKPSDDGLLLVEIDLDVDGRPEVFNYYEESSSGRVLVRKEVDLNKDGRVDVRSYYDQDGRLTREEMDGDFDGQIDWVDHYVNGERGRSEVDTDYDGVFDLFKFFGDGRLLRKERDGNADGRIDHVERFDVDGNLILEEEESGEEEGEVDPK